jgi:large subunit ribosomal protein L16
MATEPKNKKFKKDSRGVIKGEATRNRFITFGQYGLCVDDSFRMTAKQIDTLRLTVSRVLKKMGKLWIKCFADVSITKKSLGVRMGGGKGGHDSYICRVKKGQIICELGDGVLESTALAALNLVASKLPVPSHVVRKDDMITVSDIKRTRAQ